jgi:hypothetical protein
MNYQRKNSTSNTHVGRDFERAVARLLTKEFGKLESPFIIDIGHVRKKKHKFDFGSASKRIIVECKSHTWTESGNVPSAKVTTWDQAMLYFYLAPRRYRKILCCLHNRNQKNGQTLGTYYARLKEHLIPDEVEIWEIDPDGSRIVNRIAFDGM